MMLANFVRSLPSRSRWFCTAATVNAKNVLIKDHKDNQDVQEVQRVEEELFGSYYGATDSSRIVDKSRDRPKTRPFPRKSLSGPKKEIPIAKPNPWGIQNLPLHDPLLGKYVLNARNSKKTQKAPTMVVEGKRLIKDALQTGIEPQAVFVTDESHLTDFEQFREELTKSIPIYRVPIKDVSVWSSLTTPPGVLGIFKRPLQMKPPKNCLPITVICDNIREPNNLGSIFRICSALPCSQVIVTKGCADPWDAKCIRGGSGGQFHIPIEYPVLWEALSGVASESSVFLADNQCHSKSLQFRTIDQQLFSGLAKEQENIFLVIGGETHGISREAYEFAESSGRGSVVNIPMAESVDSINTASAVAVILYEIRRQLLANQ